ncbi:MAG: DUF2203 domain-containing protein [Planctomycetes bacterium]|nr:DUF2203 domain-containing protein [Planctomycetota bacterium]
MPTDASNAPTAVHRTPTPGKRYFTVTDANRALTYVSRIVEDLAPCYVRVLELRHRLEQPAAGDNREQVEAEYDREMDHLSDLVDELQQVGVEIKDLERCLVDFPAVFQGREIYLCWHRGETNVSHWHEVDAGFASRQDVAVLQTA